LRGLETFTGGLVAPESDDNPWNYKFTWNPRNVVLAGQGGVKFLQQGQFKYIPYNKVFERTETLKIRDPLSGEMMEFEGYANRDSLKYRELYGLQSLPTVFRGTLRRPNFCKAWNIFVTLGLTDNSFKMEDSEHMTYRQFINSFLMYRKSDSVELKLAYHMGLSLDSDEMKKLKWLGIFEDRKVGLKNATPAEILQKLLERKWQMREQDRDMIVMLNKYEWDNLSGQKMETLQYMVVRGDDSEHTAMAKTVGLPLAISSRMILNGKIDRKGVAVPITKDIYEPVLLQLEQEGIKFIETTREISESEL